MLRGHFMKRFVIGAALAVFPMQGLSQTYECTAEDRGSGGWVAEKVFVQIDLETKTASAYDTFINQLHKGPIPVTLERNDDKVFTLSWKLRNVKTKNMGPSVLSHSLLLDTGALTFALKGRLHGYDNLIRGNGSCRQIK